MDRDLFRFVEREIGLAHSTSPQEVKQWQQTLNELLEWELRSGMPMQVVSGPKTFKEQTLWARNAEETLFALDMLVHVILANYAAFFGVRKPLLRFSEASARPTRRE